MAQEIVPRLQTGGDDRGPGAVLRDHFPGSPEACGEIPGKQTRLVDFKPDVSARGEGLAIPIAGGHPGYHGAYGVGPGVVPVRDDGGACCDGGGEVCGRADGVAGHGAQRWVGDGVVGVPFALDG